jgi:quinol monooxygenase YgiN
MRPSRGSRPNKSAGSTLTVSAMQVSWWVELAVRPGCLDEFEQLTGEMVASARIEKGALAYQRFISDDRQTICVYERYANSGAALAHLTKFAAIATEAWLSEGASWSLAIRATTSGRCWTNTESHITGHSVHSPIGFDAST